MSISIWGLFQVRLFDLSDSGGRSRSRARRVKTARRKWRRKTLTAAPRTESLFRGDQLSAVCAWRSQRAAYRKVQQKSQQVRDEDGTPADVIANMKERAFSYFSAPYTAEALTDMLRHATDAPVWDEGIELLSATTEWLAARCDLPH